MERSYEFMNTNTQKKGYKSRTFWIRTFWIRTFWIRSCWIMKFCGCTLSLLFNMLVIIPEDGHECRLLNKKSRTQIARHGAELWIYEYKYTKKGYKSRTFWIRTFWIRTFWIRSCWIMKFCGYTVQYMLVIRAGHKVRWSVEALMSVEPLSNGTTLIWHSKKRSLTVHCIILKI